MREVSNEMMIISCKSKEGSNVSEFLRDWPVSNPLELDRIHGDVSGFQDKSQVIHLLFLKVALFGFEEKVVVLKAL